MDLEKVKKSSTQDSEISVPSSISNSVKLRNSILEVRRKSARLSDADVGRHDESFCRAPLELLGAPSVIQLEHEPINRNKKVVTSQRMASNGSSSRDYINKNAFENSVKVCRLASLLLID